MAEALAVVLEFPETFLVCWPAHVLDTGSSNRTDGDRRVVPYEIGLAHDLPRQFVGREAYMLSSTGEDCWVHCQTGRRLVRRR
jgi:hypothetical protein